MSLFGPNVKSMKRKGDIQGLIKALGYNKEVGEAACDALVEIGEPAVPDLIDVIKQPGKKFRIEALKTFRKINSNQAQEVFIELLRDKDSKVRQEAVQALGDLRDVKLKDPLVKSLEDPDWNVRNKAALALDKLSWEPNTEKDRVLYGIAKKMWTDLGMIGEGAVEPLIEALELNPVRNDVALTLGKIGNERAIPALIQMLGKEMEFTIGLLRGSSFRGNIVITSATALNNIGEPAIAPLIQALGSDHLPTRAGAELALSDTGKRAIAYLTQALEDKNQLIRDSSAKLLEKIKIETADPISPSCKVSITRLSSTIGAIVGVRVLLNGDEVGILKSGNTLDFSTSFSYNELTVNYLADNTTKSITFTAEADGHIHITLNYPKGILTIE